MHGVNFQELSLWESQFLIHLPTKNDHTLNKAKHCVMLNRPRRQDIDAPLRTHGSTCPAPCLPSLPLLQFRQEGLEASGQLLTPKAKEKSHLIAILQVSETIVFPCKCCLLTHFSCHSWKPSYTFLHNPREF